MKCRHRHSIFVRYFPTSLGFNLLSDSRQTFVWRTPTTQYHQKNNLTDAVTVIQDFPFSWGRGIILDFRTHLHVQIETMTGQIYWDIILEQHKRLLRSAVYEKISVYEWQHPFSPCKHRKLTPAFSLRNRPYGIISIHTWLEIDKACVGHAWSDMLYRPSLHQASTCLRSDNLLLHVYRNFVDHCLLNGVIFSKIRSIIW